MMVVLVILALVVGTVGVAYAIAFNRLVSDREQIGDAWAVIDVELERRHTLIPGLVAAVQVSAEHEQSLLRDLVAADQRARATNRTAVERSMPEAELGAAARAVVALRERYPALDTQQNFLQLQRELAMTEDRIGAARRFHNIKVAEYNRRTEAVPGNIVAARHDFEPATYFGS